MIGPLRLPLTLPAPRTVLLALGVALAAVSLAGTIAGSAPVAAPAASASLAERLAPGTWAMAVPLTWLSSAPRELGVGDVVDLLGARESERATMSTVATVLRVMALDEDDVVLEVGADDAASIVEAHARGLQLLAILRSTR